MNPINKYIKQQSIKSNIIRIKIEYKQNSLYKMMNKIDTNINFNKGM